MAAKVGDAVVVNGLPGVVLKVTVVGAIQTDLVSISNTAVRWFNATQLVAPLPVNPGDGNLVGAIPCTLVKISQGGPYPLYLMLLEQPVEQWILDAQINPQLPTPQPAPAAAIPAARPAPGR
jgi:hypothetical protein